MWKKLTIAGIVSLGTLGLGSGAWTIAAAPTPARTFQPLTRCTDATSPACLSAARRPLIAGMTKKKKDTKLSGGLDALAAQAQILDISAASGDQLPKALRDLTKARLMRLDNEGRVQVYVESKQPGQLVHVLEALGAKIERVNNDYGIVQAWLPAANLQSVAQLSAVTHVRLPDYGHTQAGLRMTEGDALLNADDLRSTLGVDGTGVRVGVISDGVGGLSSSQSSGDLPVVDTATCNVFGGDPGALATSGAPRAEGTAMLEIVRDLAPGAELWFGHWGMMRGGTDLDFMDAVNCLADNVDVIVDDIGFFNAGLYDGTSMVSANASAALNDASNRVRGYYTSVGNYALEHYEEQFSNSGFEINSAISFGYVGDVWAVHRFAATGSTTDAGYGWGCFGSTTSFCADRVLLPPGGVLQVFLQWNDPFGASGNDYDLLLGNETDHVLRLASVEAQNGNDHPIESFAWSNETASDQYLHVYVGRYSGVSRKLEMFLLCDECITIPDGSPDEPVHNFNTPCGSIANNSDAEGGVISLGAIDASDPGTNDIERFSSCGPTNDGRLKPDAAAVDDVTVTGDGGFGSPFFGTSAAAPHAAGIAALLLDCNPNLTRSQLHDALLNSAVDLAPPGLDYDFGYGRLDALAAANAAGCTASPTVTATSTPTRTPTPSATSTQPATTTATSPAIPTATSTPPLVPTNTATQVPTATPTPTFTPTQTPTFTPTETPTDTPTDTPTHTPTRTRTRTPTRTPTPAAGAGLGDVDCSHAISPTDAQLIVQLSAQLIARLPCPQYANVNGDGQVDTRDALLILQYVAGLIDSFP